MYDVRRDSAQTTSPLQDREASVVRDVDESIATVVPSDLESCMVVDDGASPKVELGHSARSESEPEVEAGAPSPPSDDEGRSPIATAVTVA